ncbi:MAG: hypothetical protein ACREE4_17120, partial [Stellaceae bacterium]
RTPAAAAERPQRRGRGAQRAARASVPGASVPGASVPGVSLSEATLQAVGAHSAGATANELLDYLSRELGLAVRPNHLGIALQRHRRAGRLETHDSRWFLPPHARHGSTSAASEAVGG